MTTRDKTLLTGTVLDEDVTLTLTELCRSCAISTETLMAMVDEGLLDPRDGPRRRGPPHEWRFSGVAVTRVRTARRLQEDLGINLAGAALALDLMDEMEALRARLRALEFQLHDTSREE